MRDEKNYYGKKTKMMNKNSDEQIGRQEKVEAMKKRTKAFALRIIKLYTHLPKSTEAQVLGKQLLRSGTSVEAHYHEAQRAKSNADFISKIEGALQELEETFYWLDLLKDAEIFTASQLAELMAENEELLAIFVSMVTRIKGRGK